MVDHWWCWPRNKVSLGNSASSQTCFDQNPPPCQQLQYLADQTNIGRQHCDLYFQFVRLSRLTIMRIVVITWATLCAASFSRTPWNCQCRWQIEQILANRTMLTLSPAFFASREICFCEILVRNPCPCPSVRSLSGSGFEEEWGGKKGATCQEKREEQKRIWGPERQLGI